MLVVRPQSGLANRLRALDSAAALAESFGCPMSVLWVRTPELNAAFADLFAPPVAFSVIERFSLIRDNGRAQYLSRLLWREAFLRRYSIFKTLVFHDEVIQRVRSGKGFDDLATQLPVYLESNWRFASRAQPYAGLQPLPILQDRVETLCAKFNEHTIGLHIRRADNRKSIRHSPTEAFVRVMEVALEEEPGTTFFLATDSPEEETRLRHEFGERIISRPRNLSRLTTAGIQDALVDLLCLARTRRIIGSHWSSFSEVAAEWGRLPHTTAHSP